MSGLIGGLLSFEDRLQVESLNQRLVRNQVATANVANAETPGFRAIGYDFEEHLQALAGNAEPFPLKTSDPRHFRTSHVEDDGKVYPDVFIRPQESIPEDGNTVDIDQEMSVLSSNQILYRTTAEIISRKLGVLRYAISGGR